MHRKTARATLLCLIFALAGGAAPQYASAQSVWKKLKIAALQQACRGGDQQACQALAKMGQAPTGQQRPVPRQQAGQLPSRQGTQQAVAQPQNESGPIKPPAGTRVEEQLMAPIDQETSYSISPHGMHIATVEDSGSRIVVYYDGVAGPKFDEILSNPEDTNKKELVFSPDGKRYAYCGRIGEQWVVMVDSKELARGSESNMGQITGENCKLGFTSNSQHVFYTTHFEPTGGGHEYTRFVLDGKPAPLDGSFHFVPAFSPDGNHYAFVENDPADANKYSLVIDGKTAPYVAGNPQWSADSQHLYTTLSRSMPGIGTETEALLDGKPFLKATDIKLFVPQKGNMVVAQVMVGRPNEPYHRFLVIDGKKVPGSEAENPNGQIESVTISPDGRHYAALYRTNNSKYYVFWDGKRGEQYEDVRDIGFTADSSKIAYAAQANGKSFVIYGDQESDPCFPDVKESATGIVFAQVGNHAGAACGFGNTPPTLFLDGKSMPAPGEVAEWLSFTSDGMHYAYIAGYHGGARQLVLDGVVQKESNVAAEDAGDIPQYLFSPDGTHIAHLANSPASNGALGYGIFLDGKFIYLGTSGISSNLFFTPDSKHLIWAQLVRGVVPGRMRIFVDGKPVAEVGTAVTPGPGPSPWLDISPHGTVRVLTREGNSLERLTITPSPNTSVQTFLEGAR